MRKCSSPLVYLLIISGLLLVLPGIIIYIHSITPIEINCKFKNPYASECSIKSRWFFKNKEKQANNVIKTDIKTGKKNSGKLILVTSGNREYDIETVSSNIGTARRAIVRDELNRLIAERKDFYFSYKKRMATATVSLIFLLAGTFLFFIALYEFEKRNKPNIYEMLDQPAHTDNSSAFYGENNKNKVMPYIYVQNKVNKIAKILMWILFPPLIFIILFFLYKIFLIENQGFSLHRPEFPAAVTKPAQTAPEPIKPDSLRVKKYYFYIKGSGYMQTDIDTVTALGRGYWEPQELKCVGYADGKVYFSTGYMTEKEKESFFDYMGNPTQVEANNMNTGSGVFWL